MRFLSTLVALIPLSACYTYPCETDVLACEDGDAFVVDTRCEAPDALSVELIEMQTYAPLQRDAWPRVHHGVQGGIHFDLGLRVRGLEPDHMDLRVDFQAMQCQGEDCGDEVVVAQRTLYADETLLEPEDDGVVLPNVILLLEQEPDSGGALILQVMDSCGRELEIVHDVGP